MDKFNKYLRILKWDIKLSKQDNMYYLYKNNISISPYGIGHILPDTAMILLKNTLRELRSTTPVGSFGLMVGIKERLDMVDARLLSVHNSKTRVLNELSKVQCSLNKGESILHHYDTLDNLDNTMDLNHDIKLGLEQQYLNTFGVRP